MDGLDWPAEQIENYGFKSVAFSSASGNPAKPVKIVEQRVYVLTVAKGTIDGLQGDYAQAARVLGIQAAASRLKF